MKRAFVARMFYPEAYHAARDGATLFSFEHTDAFARSGQTGVNRGHVHDLS